MRLRLFSFAMVLALLGAVAVAPISTDAKKGGLVPVDGLPQLDLTGEYYVTSASVTHFSNQGGTLIAHGILELQDYGESTFSAPVDGAWVEVEGDTAATGLQTMSRHNTQDCGILFLTLGPLYIDLLGLVIELPNELVIDIRAEGGQGNLLGNLLCAVAGLLDGPGPLGNIAGLLNNLLRNLGLAI
jgi:hypothetical protein